MVRLGVNDDLQAGRLVAVLPEFEMARVPVHVLHAFGRQLPPRARVFIDFITERVEPPP
jgi:DNA-binding transcriptional LysR family regulator